MSATGTKRRVVSLGLEAESDVEDTIYLSAIETVFLEAAIDLSGFDALILTSKRALKAIDRIDPSWKKLKTLTIGAATSKVVCDLGGAVFYQSDEQNADRFAEKIAQSFGALRFFYPRARVVSGDLEGILRRSNVFFQSAILYETRPKAIDLSKIPANAAIVFSSPSVVDSFFSQIRWREGWAAVAIGQRTAKALERYAPYAISPKADLSSAIKLARSL
ncbi:MAG: uroporphyrinogen-III synthase [Helicobacteraceae bacterium]|nr:uroporphyrinogen-III synthase [Helicobacteraceae bacterium]